MSYESRIVKPLMAALASAPHMTYEQLIEATGLPQRAIANWVLPMRAAKVVRVAAWLPDTRGYLSVAAFALSSGEPDAERTPLSGTERVRRVREKRKVGLL